jgi:hypothetical protein
LELEILCDGAGTTFIAQPPGFPEDVAKALSHACACALRNLLDPTKAQNVWLVVDAELCGLVFRNRKVASVKVV